MVAPVSCPIMVGGDTELAAVEAALKAATAGHGGCVVITGEPGIGKSRLALEAIRRARARGVRVVTGRAVPQSATAPYRPLTDALMQLLRDPAIPDDPAMEPWRPAPSAPRPGAGRPDPARGPGRPGPTALLPGSAGPAWASGETSPATRAEALIQLLRRLAPEGLV